MDLKVGDLVKNAYAMPEGRIAKVVRLTTTDITLQDLPLGFITDNYTYKLVNAYSVDMGKIRRVTKLELLLAGVDYENYK